MILLDSNQLRVEHSLDTPTISILKVLARSTGHRLALPSVAAEEYMAQYEHYVVSLLDEIDDRLEKLKRVDRGGSPAFFTSPLDAIVFQHREWLHLMFEIVPLPEGAAQKALAREMRRLLPASTVWDAPGRGARDVAIWLTALSVAKGDEEVLLVSGDARAFGKDGLLHEALVVEAHETGANLRYFQSIDVLLASFAVERRSERSRESLVADEKIRNAVAEALASPITFVDFTMRLPALDMGSAWAGHAFRIESADVQQDKALELNTSTWLSARIVWMGTREFTRVPVAPGEQETWVFEWRVPTTVIAELDKKGAITSAEVASIGRVQVLTLHPPG